MHKIVRSERFYTNRVILLFYSSLQVVKLSFTDVILSFTDKIRQTARKGDLEDEKMGHWKVGKIGSRAWDERRKKKKTCRCEYLYINLNLRIERQVFKSRCKYKSGS